MHQRLMRQGARLGLVAGIFAAGFLCGSLGPRTADAQLGEVIDNAAQKGALGPVGDLGTSILEMQDHVSGLQKNLDTLKKVKAALGG